MCSDVFLQVTGSLERLHAGAVRTLVGLFAGVRSGVTLEAVARGERLHAALHVALERLLTGVCPLVNLRTKQANEQTSEQTYKLASKKTNK